MDYLNHERWERVGLYTNDIELKEAMLTGHGETEVLPHTKLDLLNVDGKKYKVLEDRKSVV